MGRPATGNRGISLRKGDYVIGAAVTPSNEARNKTRLERAAAKGLTSQVEAAIDEAADSTAAHPPLAAVRRHPPSSRSADLRSRRRQARQARREARPHPLPHPLRLRERLRQAHRRRRSTASSPAAARASST